MYCRNCGSQIEDGAAFCPHCGVTTDPQAQTIPPQPQVQQTTTNSGLRTAAKVFIIIGMVVGCWTILPLIFGALGLSNLNKNVKPSFGISVLVLLFCNLIGGILMLVMRGEL